MRKISLFVFVISVANVHAMQKKRIKDSLACQSLRHGSRIHTAQQSYSFSLSVNRPAPLSSSKLNVNPHKTGWYLTTTVVHNYTERCCPDS